MNGVIGIPPHLVADPRCVLYLRGESTNGSTRIRDWSPSHKTATVYGNTCNSTAQTKFPPTSIYFDGTGDYLSIEASNDFNFGSGDFTISLWINTADSAGIIFQRADDYYPFSIGISTSNVNFTSYQPSSRSLNWSVVSSTTITDNLWHHICCVRSGNTQMLYIDGVKQGTDGTFSGTIETSTQITKVASSYNNAVQYAGYIDELIVWKGIAYPIGMLYPQKQRMIV